MERQKERESALLPLNQFIKSQAARLGQAKDKSQKRSPGPHEYSKDPSTSMVTCCQIMKKLELEAESIRKLRDSQNEMFTSQPFCCMKSLSQVCFVVKVYVFTL